MYDERGTRFDDRCDGDAGVVGGAGEEQFFTRALAGAVVSVVNAAHAVADHCMQTQHEADTRAGGGAAPRRRRIARGRLAAGLAVSALTHYVAVLSMA